MSSINFYAEDELVPVRGKPDQSALATAREVFLRHGGRIVLYTNPNGRPLSQSDIAKLIETHPGDVFMRKQHPSIALRQLADQLALDLLKPGVNNLEQVQAVYSAALAAVGHLYDDKPDQQTVHAATQFLRVTTPFLSNHVALITGIKKIAADDRGFYNHAASVYIFATAIASWMGIKNEIEMRDLGIGALLHDIGKTRVSQGILEKPGPLNRTEWVLVKRHSQVGESMIANLPMVSDTVRRLILEHHERCDGSGYPYGLPKQHLHRLTPILMVADMYDALTRNQPYRPAYTPFDALSLLKEQCAGPLDVEPYKALVLLLAGKNQSI
jgi:putative nucleotidyltransferase with HDIG domain